MRKRSLIIFAHSMGGLVARSAINKYSREVEGDFVELFVSICTPYGGNDAAAQGVEKAPVVIDSWLDLATGGEFIKALHETPLPEHLKFHLLFGYRNDNPVKIGPNSDGTISLESQLDSRAQSCAATVCGFNETHTSILESEEVLHKINDLLSPYTRLDSDGTESRCISQELIERYRMREGAERQEAEDRRRTTD